jgi:hypothetical protein
MGKQPPSATPAWPALQAGGQTVFALHALEKRKMLFAKEDNRINKEDIEETGSAVKTALH